MLEELKDLEKSKGSKDSKELMDLEYWMYLEDSVNSVTPVSLERKLIRYPETSSQEIDIADFGIRRGAGR